MNSNYVSILSGRDKIRDSYEKNVNHCTALSVSKQLTSWIWVCVNSIIVGISADFIYLHTRTRNKVLVAWERHCRVPAFWRTLRVHRADPRRVVSVNSVSGLQLSEIYAVSKWGQQNEHVDKKQRVLAFTVRVLYVCEMSFHAVFLHVCGSERSNHGNQWHCYQYSRYVSFSFSWICISARWKDKAHTETYEY